MNRNKENHEPPFQLVERNPPLRGGEKRALKEAVFSQGGGLYGSGF